MTKKFSCLLVEDDPDDQQIFLDALNSICEDCECFAVSDGEQALLTLIDAELLPDYIFSDLNMPKVDGFAFLAVLKSIETLREIPVIMFSSDSSERQKEKAISLGAAAFYTKGKFDVLREILKKHLRNPESSSTVL